MYWMIYFMFKSFTDNYYVSDVRYNMGIILAKNELMDFDKNKNYIVVGVPETGIISARGFANELNIEYKQIITKNKNSNRTFILGDNEKRILACNKKFLFDEKY